MEKEPGMQGAVESVGFARCPPGVVGLQPGGDLVFRCKAKSHTRLKIIK
jgi:hypothetical protein